MHDVTWPDTLSAVRPLCLIYWSGNTDQDNICLCWDESTCKGQNLNLLFDKETTWSSPRAKWFWRQQSSCCNDVHLLFRSRISSCSRFLTFKCQSHQLRTWCPRNNHKGYVCGNVERTRLRVTEGTETKSGGCSVNTLRHRSDVLVHAAFSSSLIYE